MKRIMHMIFALALAAGSTVSTAMASDCCAGDCCKNGACCRKAK